MTASAQTLPAAPQAASPTRGLRNLLFLAAFFLLWISVRPFRDLSDPERLQESTAGDTLNQLSTLLLSGALAAFVAYNNPKFLRKATTPLLVATLAWFVLSVLFADYPGLAARRLVLAVLTIVDAVAFLALPADRRHFARLLAGGTLALLAISYASVVLIPEYAIHQANDLLSADLIGAWRGPFGHKNGAGAAMVVFAFIGIFVGRSLNAALGALGVALSVVFLIFTHAKSAIVLLPIILLVSFVVARIHSPTARFCVLVALPLAICFFSVGSVWIKPLHEALMAVMPDATFSDRDKIWNFALDHVMRRPILGHGFQAFWETGDLVGHATPGDWVARSNSAHNGLLNLALTTGLVGALLAELWVLAQTAADYARIPARAADPMTGLFVQIWLFAVCWDSMESLLFGGGSGIWFMALASMFGLHFQRLALARR